VYGICSLLIPLICICGMSETMLAIDPFCFYLGLNWLVVMEEGAKIKLVESGKQNSVSPLRSFLSIRQPAFGTHRSIHKS